MQIVVPLSADNPVEFRPPALKESRPDVVIKLRVPTPSQRDLLHQRLFAAGIIGVSIDLMRGTLVDEIYNHWPEEEAEKRVNVLDRAWQLENADLGAFMDWAEKERQRVKDEEAGAPPIEPEPMPAALLSPADRHRANLYSTEVYSRSQRLRDLKNRMDSTAQSTAEMQFRLHVLPSSSGLNCTLELEPSGEKLTEDMADRLRQDIGDDAYIQILEHIDQMYSLSEEERKNSDSPLEKLSDQTGSTASSGESASSDGSSTGSSTDPIPSAGSEPTTASSSRLSAARKARKSKPSRTGRR